MSDRPNLLTALVVILGFVIGWFAVELGMTGAPLLGVLAMSYAKVAEDARRAKALRIRAAWTDAGYNLTSAAATMHMDPAEVVRALDGDRKLDTWRLELLGDEFMRFLALRELHDRGLPSLAQTAVDLAPVLVRR